MLIDYLQAVCVALGREAEMEGWYGAGADGKIRPAVAETPTKDRARMPITEPRMSRGACWAMSTPLAITPLISPMPINAATMKMAGLVGSDTNIVEP